jgi:hypothetical protein
MILNNKIIAKGPYDKVSLIYNEVNKLSDKKQLKDSMLFHKKVVKHIKSIHAHDLTYNHEDSSVQITFEYKSLGVKLLIDLFNQFGVELITYTEQEKKEIWIVSDPLQINDYRLIPEWAINDILIDYMEYKESNIILDSFENIQLDRNTSKVVVNNQQPEEGQLIDLFFNKTLKGKKVVDLLESFTISCYEKSINQYDDLYASNKEKIDGEEPTPLALFIVTFGILALIAILLVTMGYL